MTSIEVVDPETGERIRFAVRKKGQEEYYVRLPEHNHDLAQRSPRQLEALAAFSEVASEAFGKSSDEHETAAGREVRTKMPKVFPKQKIAREIRSAERQKRYREIIGEETVELLHEADATNLNLKLKRRARLTPRVPITRQVLPDASVRPPFY